MFSDADECSNNDHSCDVNAVCSNTVGSYACACKAGYTGDGGTCNGTFDCFKKGVIVQPLVSPGSSCLKHTP